MMSSHAVDPLLRLPSWPEAQNFRQVIRAGLSLNGLARRERVSLSPKLCYKVDGGISYTGHGNIDINSH